ncbi:MAG TPA: hypothetical protein VH559_08095 [Gemmatimonadaceae bacterium]|jgi:hypothetical protein
MAGERDWEKELAKIDRQLASLPDEQLLPEREAGTWKKREVAPAKSTKAPPAPGRSVSAESDRPRKGLMYLRVLLSLALGAGMLFWPYEARCGVGLVAYLGAVAVVIASGIWSSIWTWRHRASRAHALSLLVILWGLVLGSTEVLPRIGYTKPDPLHPASWACH